MQNRTTVDQFMLRLPDGWRSLIKERAVKNRRSMNQEILAALESVVSAAEGAKFGDQTPPAASRTDALPGVNSING